MPLSQRGKKFDTWTFEHKGITVSVTVKAREYSGGRHSYETPKIEFFVREPDYDIKDEDTDVNALKKRVKEKIVAQLEDSITWERFWHVSWRGTSGDLDPEDEEQTANTETDLSFTLVEVGTRRDGSKLWRRVMPGTKAHWSTSHCQEGMPDIGRETNYWGKKVGCLYSLVPMTLENTAALTRIHAAFKTLHKELDLLLSPERIESSLQGLSDSLFRHMAIDAPEVSR